MTLAPECWVGKGQSLKQPPVEVIFFGGLEKNISCWISQPQNSGLTFFFWEGGKVDSKFVAILQVLLFG